MADQNQNIDWEALANQLMAKQGLGYQTPAGMPPKGVQAIDYHNPSAVNVLSNGGSPLSKVNLPAADNPGDPTGQGLVDWLRPGGSGDAAVSGMGKNSVLNDMFAKWNLNANDPMHVRILKQLLSQAGQPLKTGGKTLK